MFDNKEYILKIHEDHSFSKAAEHLYMSQPSLSAIVKRTENKIGEPLFDRGKNPIELTECGKEYVKIAKEILAAEERFRTFLSAHRQCLTGVLTIGGSNMNISYVLPPLLQLFQDIYPGIHVNIVEGNISDLKTLSESLPEVIDAKCAHTILESIQQFLLLSRKIGTFISLNSSTDTTDSETVGWSNRISNLGSSASKPLTVLNKALASVDLEKCAEEDDLIKEHFFYIQEIQNKAKYMLSDEVEEAISKMELNASDAWDSLQSYMTSTVEIPYNGQTMTLSSIRNLAYSPDAEVRKNAYKAELAGYDKIKDAVAFALNSIKGEANTIAEMRGYDSVLDMTLVTSRMKKETLEAMLNAMKKYLPEFHRYLKHKAKLFGHENGLPFYDLFATLSCD